MNTSKYESVRQMIENSRGVVDFAPFGKGTTDQWIDKAQKRLNVTFPESYVWWLKNYSGGTIHGDEIFSIYELDFDTVVGGDVVYMNELNRKNGTSTPDQLVICETDDGSVFYFNLKEESQREFPVYDKSSNSKYADTFLDFLIKQITS